MFNQVSLEGPARLIGVAAWRRGFLISTAPARPPRRSAPRRSESYFEDGLMKRELHRL